MYLFEYARACMCMYVYVCIRKCVYMYAFMYCSIAESDGEDDLHVFLPPIDPDVLTGEKSVEEEQVRMSVSVSV